MQRTFHRQQQAIEFIRLYRRFDNDIKVLLAYLFNKQLFSYETVSTKQRVFMVLNETEFKWEYENQRYEHSPLQHTYEIILENCPCKLYMDVEVVEDSSFLVVQIRDESREEWNGPSSAAAPLYFVLSALFRTVSFIVSESSSRRSTTPAFSARAARSSVAMFF